MTSFPFFPFSSLSVLLVPFLSLVPLFLDGVSGWRIRGVIYEICYKAELLLPLPSFLVQRLSVTWQLDTYNYTIRVLTTHFFPPSRDFFHPFVFLAFPCVVQKSTMFLKGKSSVLHQQKGNHVLALFHPLPSRARSRCSTCTISFFVFFFFCFFLLYQTWRVFCMKLMKGR